MQGDFTIYDINHYIVYDSAGIDSSYYLKRGCRGSPLLTNPSPRFLEVRIENGVDSKFSNYIKILSALNMLDNIDVLIPEMQPDFKALFEEKPARKRATSSNEKKNTNWVWEEDK